MLFYNFVKKNAGSLVIICIRILCFMLSDIYDIKTPVLDNGSIVTKYDSVYSLVFILFLTLNTKIVFFETKKNEVYLCYAKAMLSILFSIFLYRHTNLNTIVEVLQILDLFNYYMKDKSEEDHGIMARRKKY